MNSYPTLEIVSGFEEGTTDKELEACLWVRESLPENATVVSDHRMSSMIFGFGELNSSWDYTPQTFHGESFDEMEEEAAGVGLPSGTKRIDYVMISKPMRKGVTLKQWEPAKPMSKNASEKFEKAPFIKLYDNGEVQLYGVFNNH
jgi:hypothetical protein